MRRSQAYFPEVRIGKGTESGLCSQYTPPASNVFYICTLSTLCSVHSTCYWPQPADLIMQPLRTLGKALAYKSTNTHPSCWYRFQDLVDTFSERQYCLNFQGSRPTSTQGPRLQITDTEPPALSSGGMLWNALYALYLQNKKHCDLKNNGKEEDFPTMAVDQLSVRWG